MLLELGFRDSGTIRLPPSDEELRLFTSDA
jgi:hypothetical protein